MSGVHDQSHLAGEERRDAAFVNTNERGHVRNTPTTVDDLLIVHLDGYSRAYTFDVPGKNWMPRTVADGDDSQTLLPTEGVTCLVVFDNCGDAWVPAWGTA